ncbi:MAG: serine hydrolase [Chitinispirillaceae bacterium]|nr:serine hydrolase [Chitinispirillaceae bacterium]
MKKVWLLCLYTFYLITVLSVTGYPIAMANNPRELQQKETNVNTAALKIVCEKAEKKRCLTSIFIVEDGTVLCEHYRHENIWKNPQDICSAAKTVIGLLVGIAVKKGCIQSIEDPVSHYLPDVPDNRDGRKNEIRINHLLTMTSGLEWSNDDYKALEVSNDPLQYVLSKPLTSLPSERFNYDVSAFLLSAILEKACGRRTDRFAEKNLFEPLGISTAKWDSLGEYTVGYNGLHLLPEDMVKLGLFMLQNGCIGADSLLPSDWMNEMSRNQVKNGIGASIDGMGVAEEGRYGYMCWVAWKGTTRFYWAGGFGGQRIIMVPEKKLVVVMTAWVQRRVWMFRQSYWKKAAQQDRDLLNFFINEILAAF